DAQYFAEGESESMTARSEGRTGAPIFASSLAACACSTQSGESSFLTSAEICAESCVPAPKPSSSAARAVRIIVSSLVPMDRPDRPAFRSPSWPEDWDDPAAPEFPLYRAHFLASPSQTGIVGARTWRTFMLETVRLLHDYTRWADLRMFEAVAKLSPEQYTKDLGSSLKSVRDTVVHLVSAQWIWLSRWNGIVPKGMWNAADYPDLVSVRAARE